MKEKTTIFGSAGQQDATKRNETAYRSGMTPNTIAYAEDVNTFGNMSDEFVYILCQEIVNALRQQNIEPDALDNTQVAQLINHLNGGYTLTGLTDDTVSASATSSAVTFTGKISFNSKVYYGSSQADRTVVDFDAVTLSVDNTWTPGVNYIFATSSGALGNQTTPVLGSEGATKCMLGSLFVIDNDGALEIQEGSFAFNPWLMSTTRETREVTTAKTKGGFITAVSGTVVDMGALEVVAEGINYGETGSGKYSPDVITFPEGTYEDFPYLFPDYITTQARFESIDTTHIYNMTTETWDELDSTYYDKFMVQVPCVAPTGQRMMVPAMSDEEDGVYSQLFDSQAAAEAAIFGLQYTSTSSDTTRARAIYAGQSIIVRVGATDLTYGEDFKTVGIIPQQLSGYTASAGQSGGSVGNFVPMREIELTGTAVTLINQCSNVIVGSADAPVVVTMPSPNIGFANQLMVKYIAVDDDNQTQLQGITFPNTVRWWTTVPQFVQGCAYVIVFDYIQGYWYGSYQAYQQMN